MHSADNPMPVSLMETIRRPSGFASDLIVNSLAGTIFSGMGNHMDVL